MTEALTTQPELLPSTQMPSGLFEAGESHGHWTAARLFLKRPETAAQIQGMLAEGVGILRIARNCHVSPSTVIAVRDQSTAEIDKQARQVGHSAMSVARQSVEAIQEAIDDPELRKKVSPRDWAIIAGVMVDKSQLLSGLPTSINLTAHADLPSHEEYERMLNQMGSGGEDGGPKGRSPIGPHAATPGDRAGSEGSVPVSAPGATVELVERDGVLQADPKGVNHE